ncbi:MAG: hypothetical protein LBU65_04175 [Planctomycetaceae bacterium]|jgi:hypothetical protein|nr:hypothetical protein [Planctomycetaceae bacterium]
MKTTTRLLPVLLTLLSIPLCAYAESTLALNPLLDDFARQISAKMQEKNITMTGVLPFFSVSSDGNVTVGTAELGLLPGMCTERLEKELVKNLPSGCESVRYQRVQSALAEHGIKVEDIYSGKMDAVGTVKFVDTKSLNSFIVGKITRLNNDGLVEISCELTGLPNTTALGTFTGKVQLSQAELAGMGRSMQSPQLAQAAGKVSATATVTNFAANAVDPEYRPGLTANTIAVENAAKNIIEPPARATVMTDISLVPLTDEQAELFRVTVVVKRSGRFVPVKPIKKGDKSFIPLERGDVYKIRIYNPTTETVMTRVLVDGLNTLPEKIEPLENVKFTAVSEADTMKYIESLKLAGAIVVQNDDGFYRVAPPSGLDNARPWILRPRAEVEISGFFYSDGSDGNYKEFKVTDAPFSVGGQTNFTDQLGMITVGFFTAIPKSKTTTKGFTERRIGTGMGQSYQQKVIVTDSLIVGGILETHQYFYAPRSDIEAIGSTGKPTERNIPTRYRRR